MKYLLHSAIAVFCILPSLLRAGTVTNAAGDTTPGSLRSVIAAAVANETITFAANLSGETIPLGGDDIFLSKNLTIDASNLPGGLTIDGENLSRVFWVDINTAPTVAITGLSIINGAETAASGSTFPRGGGIFLAGGDLTLTDCTLSGNSSDLGGGIYCSDGSFTLTNCTLSGNSSGIGGGIYIKGPNSLGITRNYILSNCTLSENSATATGGGIHVGGEVSHGTASLTLSKCTLSGNSAVSQNGGGLYIGSSVNGPNITAALDHCTFSGNSAGFQGGGISASDSNALPCTLSITSCTLSGNSAEFDGGGIFVNDANFTLTASIVSGNTAVHSQAQGPDLRRIDGPDGTGSITNNLVGGSAMLAALGDFGGPTETMPPQDGSPAIDAGGTTDPGGTDQRGFPRFLDGALDRGAVETRAGSFLVVDTVIDEDDGIALGGVSLRDAIAATPPDNTITFASALDGGVITLANGQLLIDKNLTIDASALAGGITIDANGAVTSHRVLQVEPGVAVVLDHLILTGGSTPDDGAAEDRDGGGIYNSGELTCTDCTIADNATGSGPGGHGGGIFNNDSASLTLDRCTVSGNTTGNGIGLLVSAGGNGGGIYNRTSSILMLTDCTVSGNVTGNGGNSGSGGSGGGIFSASDASPTLVGCTISGNRTGNGGFGFPSHGGSGGGICNLNGNLSLTHCTIAGNVTGDLGDNGSAGSGGGIIGFSNTSLVLAHCTISGNSTGDGGSGGGGIRALGDLEIDNCLISGNFLGTLGSGADLAEVGGTFSRSGINFIGDLSGSGQSPSGTLLSGDAMLAPLGDNGGATLTMRPLLSSPVIDPVGGDTSSPFSTDQRGFDRIVNGIVDIGAVESVPPPIIVDTNIDEDDGVSVGGISLRDAIAAAESNTTIGFLPALGGTTIILTNGQLVIVLRTTLISGCVSKLTSGDFSKISTL